jgi:hypothetical protein
MIPKPAEEVFEVKPENGEQKRKERVTMDLKDAISQGLLFAEKKSTSKNGEKAQPVVIEEINEEWTGCKN